MPDIYECDDEDRTSGTHSFYKQGFWQIRVR